MDRTEIEMNKKEEVMIRIKGLRKKYRLGLIGPGTLQGAIKERRQRANEGTDDKKDGEKTGDGKTIYALNGIDLTVHKGEKLGIIGRNGAGKSTLLKILSRITAPTEGQAELFGRVTSMLEVGTGFHGDMTGRENIYLNGAILGMTKEEIESKMDDIIRFSELEEFIDTPVKRYSSGMYVKLGFSVAVHLESEIVIMDEVLAVGDMDFQRKCISRLLDAANDESRTVLYVSHNMNTIRRLCDRCIVLDKGRIIFDGDVEQAIAIYLGEADEMSAVTEFGPQHRPYDAQIRLTKQFGFIRLKFLEKEKPVYRNSEKASVELTCEAYRTLKRVGFRLEIWSQSGGLAGSSLSGNFVDFEEGESRVRIEMPMAHLASGQYHADLLAFQFDENGREYLLDAVYPGFLFRIEPEEDGTDYLDWNHQYWGPVRLHDLKAEKTALPEKQ